jgi:hypothetical protein
MPLRITIPRKKDVNLREKWSRVLHRDRKPYKKLISEPT